MDDGADFLVVSKDRRSSAGFADYGSVFCRAQVHPIEPGLIAEISARVPPGTAARVGIGDMLGGGLYLRVRASDYSRG